MQRYRTAVRPPIGKDVDTTHANITALSVWGRKRSNDCEREGPKSLASPIGAAPAGAPVVMVVFIRRSPHGSAPPPWGGVRRPEPQDSNLHTSRGTFAGF